MKHLSLAILTAAVALGLLPPLAHAELIIVDGKQAPMPVSPAPRPVPVSPAPRPVPVSPAPMPVSPATRPVPAATPASTASAPALPMVPASATQGRLVQVGAPLPGPAVQGWADDVPLSLALEQVVPSGWKLETGSVDTGRSVSWRGDRSWHAIVGDLAHANHFDVRIDWVAQRVTLGPVGSLAPSVAGSVAPVRKESSAQEMVAEPEPRAMIVAAGPVTTAPVVPLGLKPIAPPAAVWTLDPAKTLRENITAWAQKAGWNRVVWEGADYPVVAPATFTGDFASEKGPIATVIAAYDRSEQPLLARLSLRDKVVLVTNRNYVPTTVSPTAPSTISPQTFPTVGVGGTP